MVGSIPRSFAQNSVRLTLSSCGGRFASTKGSGAIRKRSGHGGVRSSGATPTCSLIGAVPNLRSDDGSRMNREIHVRFWEGVGLRCPALLAYLKVLTLIRQKSACKFFWLRLLTSAGREGGQGFEFAVAGPRGR